MQHIPATIEDQLILKAVKEECVWEHLPKRLQVTLNSKEDWHRKVIDHCIKKRLLWNTCFARKICKEGEYYEEMMRYLRRNLALFPYHLAEYVSRVLRVSPFKYYCDILFEVMKNEQPYDSIPNFSAADALRITGIGRNEFIDIMNKCRSKKIMWKLNKSIAKELLPTQPIDFWIDPWWGVCLVNFTLEEFKKLSEDEMATIDRICKEQVNAFILFDPEVIKGLSKRGLIYFDVPVYPDDRFKVSRLEGFVSNREQSYEDPIEELLYAVFVVSNENSTVSELATTLQADLSQLQAAASFACRLGWAEKLLDPSTILQDTNVPKSPKSSLSDEETDQSQSDITWTETYRSASGFSHVAFVVDANITSYLMMGSVSPGLKSHAVTLYEAGKLGYASMSDLCRSLITLEGTKFEGELQEFANHAFSLRWVLECLTSGGVDSNEKEKDKIGITSLGNDEVKVTNDVDPTKEQENEVVKKLKKYRVDVLRCESLAALSPATLERLFLRDYDIVVSMVPLPHASIIPGPKGPIHFGPPSYSSMTPWMKLVLYSVSTSGPLSVVFIKGQCLRLLPPPLYGCEKALIWSWDDLNIGGLGSKFEGNLVKGNVLLHCLNSLLKYSAVLVQPLSKNDLNEKGKIVTLDVPLPLKNFDGSTACIGEELGLNEEESIKLNSMLFNLGNKINLWTMGYIRLLRLYKEKSLTNFVTENDLYEWVPLSVEFGVPLFSPKLCRNICKRVVASHLLQTDLLSEYHESMQDLRRKLRDACNEYQSTGPTARLLYQKEQTSKEKKLMNYASGRWNPLVDPSSPISNASNNSPRVKLANRQRCKTEILSFDGNILRSYALAPVSEYEGGVVEESVSIGKSDEVDSKEVVLPGVNLLFDGAELRPFDIGACLLARQSVSLIGDASVASAGYAVK